MIFTTIKKKNQALIREEMSLKVFVFNSPFLLTVKTYHWWDDSSSMLKLRQVQWVWFYG